MSFSIPSAIDNSGAVTTVTPSSGLSSGSTFPLGSTELAWSFVDASGNSAECRFNVTVQLLGKFLSCRARRYFLVTDRVLLLNRSNTTRDHELLQ